MALLAAYMTDKEAGETLPDFLSDRVFKDAASQMGVRDEYFKFRYEQYLERAKEWCEVNEIRYRRKR
jgi:hypothetical protein